MVNLKHQVFEALKDLAKAYGKDSITQDRLEIYTSFLVNELTVQELRNSFSKILTSCKFFPSIAEIMELARPKAEVTDEAVLIASRVLECARSFSYADIKGAKEFLGVYFPIAERYGWKNLVELQYSELQTARAQLRELAKAHINFTLKNQDQNLNQLRPSKESDSLLRSLSNTLPIETGRE